MADTAVTPQRVDETALMRQTTDTRSQANAIQVTDNASMVEASNFLRQIKTVKNTIDAEMDPVIKKAHEAHKAAVALKKKFTDPLTEAENTVKRKIGAYTQEQERIRREEEARLRQEAMRAEEERRLQEAVALEEAGEAEQAEEVLAQPVAPPVVVVAKATPKVEGVSTRKVWKFRIVDANAIPREYMVPNEKAIGALARSLCDKAKLAGVEFYSEDTVAVAGF